MGGSQQYNQNKKELYPPDKVLFIITIFIIKTEKPAGRLAFLTNRTLQFYLIISF